MTFIKSLLYVTFVFEVENANLANKSKITAKNALNNIFMIFIFFKKRFANVLPKNFAIDIKK